MNTDTIGYLSVIKVGQRYKYLQLRRSVSEKNKNDGTRQVKKEVIYYFGSLDKAKSNFYDWRDNPKRFPTELISLGYTLYDLDDWILTLETGITKTGRKLDL